MFAVRILAAILAALALGWVIYHAVIYFQGGAAAQIVGELFLWRIVAGIFAMLLFAGTAWALGWRE